MAIILVAEPRQEGSRRRLLLAASSLDSICPPASQMSSCQIWIQIWFRKVAKEGKWVLVLRGFKSGDRALWIESRKTRTRRGIKCTCVCIVLGVCVREKQVRSGGVFSIAPLPFLYGFLLCFREAGRRSSSLATGVINEVTTDLDRTRVISDRLESLESCETSLIRRSGQSSI